MIQVLGDHILHKILLKVREAKLIADEVTDTFNKEQIGVVLRYVSPTDNSICEDLVSLVECSGGITGQVLVDMLLDFFTRYGVDPTSLREQAFDGASNIMAGRVKGTAACIRCSFPLALYVHCASHSLNLAVICSFEEDAGRNMIGIVIECQPLSLQIPKDRGS